MRKPRRLRLLNTIFMYKIPIFLAAISLVGCASYPRKISSACNHHPANPCVSVVPFKPSHTLDIDEENLPEPPIIERKMHHMHHDDHSQNERDHEEDK